MMNWVYSARKESRNTASKFPTAMIALVLLVITFFWSTAHTQPEPQIQRNPIALAHTTVIDSTTGSVHPDMTVVIVGNRISEVGKADQVTIPKSTQSIDGRGKFLIPGLWDMHVHIFSGGHFSELAPLLIANGITGVREMGTYVPLPTIIGIRKQIAEGQFFGPRIIAAGPVLDARFKDWTNSNVSTPDEARDAVRLLKREGADFIKIYDNLSRSEYFAIADESRKQSITFVGHVPWGISPREAAVAGQKSIEHLTGILPACSSVEAEIRRQYDEASNEPDFSLANVKGERADIRAADTFSPKQCTELAAVLRAHETWQCPTLVEQRATHAYDPNSMLQDARSKYIPASLKSEWVPEKDVFMKGFTAADRDGRVRLYRRLVGLVGLLHVGGVHFLAGTDLGRPFIFPGFSLHDELAFLVQAGLTPAEALKTSTYNPAKFLGMLDRLGTVEKGKLADLVLLDANPLEDIHNAQKIRAVILNGRYIDRVTLDNLLADAVKNASRR